MAKLYFYYSAMNAGKSTNLLQSNYNYLERGMETILLAPHFDDREAQGTIHSRIGLTAQAYPFKQDCNLYEYVSSQLIEKPNVRCVLVDEAQFLTHAQVLQLAEVVDLIRLPVLAFGLRSDFQGEVFEGAKYLLGLAEELVELKTVCSCGRKATMNLRVDEHMNAVLEGEQVEIGGNDRYIASCRIHFKEALAKAKARQKLKHLEVECET